MLSLFTRSQPRLSVPRHAVLLVLATAALFAGCAASTATTRASSPTATVPPLDAATQAYVQVLRTDYPPFVAAEQQEYDLCWEVFAPQPLAPCRPLEVAAVTAAQTLLSHLATTPPGSSWQAWDTALQHALRAAIAYNTNRIQAIDAGDRARFHLQRGDGNAAASLLCMTIMQMDAGPPPLSPSIPVPAYTLDPQHSGCLSA